MLNHVLNFEASAILASYLNYGLILACFWNFSKSQKYVHVNHHFLRRATLELDEVLYIARRRVSTGHTKNSALEFKKLLRKWITLFVKFEELTKIGDWNEHNSPWSIDPSFIICIPVVHHCTYNYTKWFVSIFFCVAAKVTQKQRNKPRYHQGITHRLTIKVTSLNFLVVIFEFLGKFHYRRRIFRFFKK